MNNDSINTYRYLLIFLFCLCLAFKSSSVSAQDTSDDEFEVYLSFQHRGIINSVVTSYYKNDTFYLPIADLFRLFNIEANVDGLNISGDFSVSQTPYIIDFERQKILFGDFEYEITIDDYILKELDSFLKVDKIVEIFDLKFSIDFNTLTLNLDHNTPLPIIEQIIRVQRRTIANFNSFERVDYPLEYDRKVSMINGGFLDYGITAIRNQDHNVLNINNSIGLQLLGGDMEGTFFSNITPESESVSSTDLRWRYITRNRFLTDITIGQTNMDGVLMNPYTGIRLSNEPYEPRNLFDEFEIEGNTFPESEVELFLNNRLVDFQKTDEIGNYRFLAPLTYGSSQLDLRIYGPTGQVIQESTRIQVPFSFLPTGEFNYNINAGLLDNSIIGSTDKVRALQGNISYGFNSWLTARLGTEYYNSESISSEVSFTSTISARLLDSYLVTLEGVTNSYFRSSISNIYPNAASISLVYSNYNNAQTIFNSSGLDSDVLGNIYYPFSMFSIPFNVRVSNFSRFRNDQSFSTFRLDFGSQLRKLNLSLGYTDRLIDSFNFFAPSSLSKLDFTTTYNFSRDRSLPRFIRGTFIRQQISFLPENSKIESFQLQISRSISTRGRFQLSLGRNFITEFNSLRFNLVFDLNKLRLNSTFSTIGSNYSTSQNIRGSVAYDSNYKSFLLSSREQVGKAGSAIRLYIDNNANNVYDEGDQLMDGGSVKFGRTGASYYPKNGILYYTQLLPYFRYNVEMNEESIENPMLVADTDKFSIITDPNTFKSIDIPFYMSGVIDGIVERVFSETNTSGIGGLKLILESEEKEIRKEIRTYSDGIFYDYELPPGNYQISIDNNQLDLLQVDSNPEVIDFEIQAVADGDFVEGLYFKLTPRNDEDSSAIQENLITLERVTEEIKTLPEILEYSQEVFGTIDDALRFIVRAQNAFYSKNIDVAFRLVSESLELFETAQGHALKGSFYYFEGNIEQAQRHWEQALRFNPDLYIPDMETLEERITTSASD